MSLAAKLRAISVASAAIFPTGFADTCLIVAVLSQAAARASATDIAGKVQGANCPIVGSTVALYAAGARLRCKWPGVRRTTTGHSS